MTELCELIKAQLTHPVADLPLYRDLMPPERRLEGEDSDYPTVRCILAGLVTRNPAGLVYERRPEERLIVSCRYHAILLASILRSRGVAVRVRYGFARYLWAGHNVCHVICEVWDDEQGRWELVDPDRKMVDFPRDQFVSGGEAWLCYRRGEIDPKTYGVGDWWGEPVILSELCHDLAAVLGGEHLYWIQPRVSHEAGSDVGSIPDDRMEVLDRVAALLQNPDDDFEELRSVYGEHEWIQLGR